MLSKVFVVLAAAALASANDLREGKNATNGIKPVFQGHFLAEWAFARPAKEVFVNVSGLITGINVTDLREGKDGVASIVSGGVGHDNVTISLKSPAALRGYDFQIEVFADEEIGRGNRDIAEPEPLAPENKTAEPEATITGNPASTVVPESTVEPQSVSTTSNSAHVTVSTAPKSATEPTKLASDIPSVSVTGPITGSTGQPEVTGYTGKPVPRMDVDIPEEPEVAKYKF